MPHHHHMETSESCRGLLVCTQFYFSWTGSNPILSPWRSSGWTNRTCPDEARDAAYQIPLSTTGWYRGDIDPFWNLSASSPNGGEVPPTIIGRRQRFISSEVRAFWVSLILTIDDIYIASLRPRMVKFVPQRYLFYFPKPMTISSIRLSPTSPWLQIIWARSKTDNLDALDQLCWKDWTQRLWPRSPFCDSNIGAIISIYVVFSLH